MTKYTSKDNVLKIGKKEESIFLNFNDKEKNDITLKELVELSKYTAMSPAQRSENGVWKNDQKKEGIVSVLVGIDMSTFSNSDRESCEKRSKNTNNFSHIFYNSLEDHITEVSLDGNNRTICFKQFFNNEIEFLATYKTQLPTGEVLTLHGRYKDLDKVTKEYFDNFKVSLVRYKNLTLKECDDVFNKTNNGSPLSAQEKKEAVSSINKQLIFSLRDENIDVLCVMLGEKKNISDLTKIIVQLIQLLLNEPMSSKNTYGFYRTDESLAKIQSISSTFNKIMSVLRKILNDCDNIEDFIKEEKLKKATTKRISFTNIKKKTSFIFASFMFAKEVFELEKSDKNLNVIYRTLFENYNKAEKNIKRPFTLNVGRKEKEENFHTLCKNPYSLEKHKIIKEEVIGLGSMAFLKSI